MSFDVELAAAPRAFVVRVRAAMFAFAAGSIVLALVRADGVDLGWIAASAVAIVAISCLPRAPMLADGRLAIGQSEGASWRRSGAPQPAAEAVRIERWVLLGSFAWLRLRFPDGLARDLLLLRPPLEHEGWRRLRAWLAWHARGGHADAPAGAPRRQ